MSRVQIPNTAAPMVDPQGRPTVITQRLIADLTARINRAIELPDTATALDIRNALRGDS